MDMGDIHELNAEEPVPEEHADPPDEAPEENTQTLEDQIIAEDQSDGVQAIDGEVLLSDITTNTQLTFPLLHQAAMGQQLIIVTQPDGSNIAVQGNLSDLLEPATKRLRVEGDEDGQTYVQVKQEDGQTYMLAVTNSDDILNGEQLVEEASQCLKNEAVKGQQALDEPIAESVETTVDDNDDEEFKGKKGKGMDVSQAWFTTKGDKSSLQNNGCQWKQGQWSREEVDLLQQNINAYCKDHNIRDPTEIIFEMSKDDRKDFYRTIARGLERPLFSVYRRVIRMYDQRNHVGKYTPVELDKLKLLRMKHGSDWASIGLALGRSASSVKDRCRLMKDTCNSGKWLPDEERLLSAAVYELSGAKPGDSVTGGLSWAQVAEKVGTRSEKQCRTKWLNYLNWKHRGGTEWTREDDMLLVERILQTEVVEESQVDWAALSEGWASARSPQWLRAKWWSLKRHVPDYQVLDFQAIVHTLHTSYAQNIRFKITPGASKENTVAPPPMFNLHNIQGIQNLQQLQNLTMAVPLTLQTQEVDGVQGVIPVSETGEVLSNLQTLEYNIGAVSQPPGTILIAQPPGVGVPGITLNGAGGLTSDQIIVHTLPFSQLQGGENMSVQLGAQPHVILTAPMQQGQGELNGDVVTVPGLSLDESVITGSQVVTLAAECLTSTEQVSLTQDVNGDDHLNDTAVNASINCTNVESHIDATSIDANIDGSAIDTHIDGAAIDTHIDGAAIDTHIDGAGMDTHIDGTSIDAPIDGTSVASHMDGTDGVIAISISGHFIPREGLVQEDGVDPSVTSHLALVSSPQLIQSSSNDGDLIHMSSLTDPMLPSESTDLMGTTLDVEGDKGPVESETESHSPAS